MAAKAPGFSVGDHVVYPKHGVGRIVELQATEIAGAKLELYVLRFDKERMTLRVPMNKAEAVGMRKLSSQATLADAMTTLKGKPKVKRTMWSRPAPRRGPAGAELLRTPDLRSGDRPSRSRTRRHGRRRRGCGADQDRGSAHEKARQRKGAAGRCRGLMAASVFS